MHRNFKKTLLQWKDHPLRVPLIVRGARQVGKTYIVECFGKEEFPNMLTINFETSPFFASCFDTLDPKQILGQIELISRQKIIAGQTLLFLDEIQQCPKALQSLRYFKENIPALHVIAAGSLLEFAIQEENFSFPVGRIQFARLYPLSFEEYLEASGETSLKEALATFDWNHLPSEAIHQYLLSKVKEYFIIGGMPAALIAYLTTKSYLEVQYVQKSLWDSFESDFGKYARKSQHRFLRKIFESTPRLVGDHIKYNRIDPELPNPAREVKQALEILKLAGLLHPVFATSAEALPLLSGLRENVFKLLILDIGLLGQTMRVDFQFPHLMTGPMAEQFVGQELLASSNPLLDEKLFFWTRPQATAEVDYLFSHTGNVYPIEVKAGKTGKLKSLSVFLQEKQTLFGIKISQEALSKTKNILSIPLYLTSHLPRLVDSA